MTNAKPNEIGQTDFALREHRSLWRDAWRRLVSSNTARLGIAIVAVFVLSAGLSHFLWEYDPRIDLDYSLKLKPPNLRPTEEVASIHPFGTDKLGRDIFRRVVHGGWNSLRVGVVAVGISLSVGGILGLLAGFYERVPLTFIGRGILLSATALALGLLPAWLADQPLHALLFFALGIGALYLGNAPAQGGFRRVSLARVLAFAGLGLVIGGGPALSVSLPTAIACGVVGSFIGALVALPLDGPFVSNVIMRLMDMILAFPAYLLAIAIVAFLGPGLEKGMIAIGFVGIPTYARLVRSTVLSVVQKEYILAAQSVGSGHGRLLLRHIVPNSLSPMIVQLTMGLASAILWAGALGFLGLGAIPPEPEWGAMLGDSYRFLTSGAWWAVLFPGLAIMLSVLGFNLLGDGLRDALDPRLTR
jgi:ABC-type dipeptide/oligopeptide/nickel transport system permease subunit